MLPEGALGTHEVGSRRPQREPPRSRGGAALLRVARPVTVDAGTCVLEAGSEVRDIYIVRQGEVRLRVDGQHGLRATVAIVRRGGVLADIPVFADQTMPYDADVTEPAELLAVGRRDFLALLQREPELGLQWLRSVACRLQQLRRHRLLLAAGDLREQVARLLIDAREWDHDAGVIVRLSHADIADMLGARRPSVSRVIRSLREDGLVETGYRRLRIEDLEGLERAAGPPIGPPPCSHRPPLPFLA